MKFLILTFSISIVVLLVGVCYTVIELDFRRKSKVISAFCSKPKKENDDARSEPVNKNNTPLKSLKCVTNLTPITLDMEQVKIKNSMKNISLPSKNSYLNAIIEKVEPFINCRTSTNSFIVQTLLKVYLFDLPFPPVERNDETTCWEHYFYDFRGAGESPAGGLCPPNFCSCPRDLFFVPPTFFGGEEKFAGFGRKKRLNL